MTRSLQVFANRRQVHETIDQAHHMTFGNMLLKAELVEQCLLHPRPLAHHPHRPPACCDTESAGSNYRKMKPQSSLKKSPVKAPAEHVVKDIRRQTRRQFSAEDEIRIVLDGLRGEDSIAELCRREGIAQSLYYTWSKEFMAAGKRRLARDTARAASNGDVQDLRREARALKERVADLTLENRLLKKSMIADGGDQE